MPQVVLLGATVAVVLLGHRRVRPAITVAVAVAVGLLTGIVEWEASIDAVRPLAAPLGFLAVAVPVAVLLDRVGFFGAAADWVTARRLAAGSRLPAVLWVFAAVVTTLFNLDAAIVLLTPLYLKIAVRRGLDPVATAFQPVLLASLASSALPVSNLTNLIVAEVTDADAGEFLVRLGPASLAATAVGWYAYRHATRPSTTLWQPQRRIVSPALPPRDASNSVAATPPDSASLRLPKNSGRAWAVGGPAVVVLLIGFTLGDVLGVPAWLVASAVAVGLVAATRTLPWRALPVEAVVVAGGLAVLAGAAVAHLGLDRLLAGTGPLAEARAFGAGVVGANAVNNLPALLVGLPNLAEPTMWAYLLGVNVGPLLWISGSLAGLLWADVMAGHGHPVTAGQYARVGRRVGLPALLLAGAVAVATSRVV